MHLLVSELWKRGLSENWIEGTSSGSEDGLDADAGTRGFRDLLCFGRDRVPTMCCFDTSFGNNFPVAAPYVIVVKFFLASLCGTSFLDNGTDFSFDTACFRVRNFGSKSTHFARNQP